MKRSLTKKLGPFVGLVQEFVDRSAAMSVAETLTMVVEKVKYLEHLKVRELRACQPRVPYRWGLTVALL